MFIRDVSNMTSPENLSPEQASVYADEINALVTGSMKKYIKFFCILGACMLVLGALSVALWMWTAERQSTRIRKLLFHAIMRQHIGWFDEQQVGELTTRLADDINNIQNGIGDKVSLFISYTTTFFAGYILGLVQGWKLTLVIISLAPLIAVAIGILVIVSTVSPL
jgi:ABC-type multidrug transport system fused ATPase/permease subunit